MSSLDCWSFSPSLVIHSLKFFLPVWPACWQRCFCPIRSGGSGLFQADLYYQKRSYGYNNQIVATDTCCTTNCWSIESFLAFWSPGPGPGRMEDKNIWASISRWLRGPLLHSGHWPYSVVIALQVEKEPSSLCQKSWPSSLHCHRSLHFYSQSSNSACPSLSTVGVQAFEDAGFWRKSSQFLSYHSCCCTVCWPPPTAPLLGNTDHEHSYSTGRNTLSLVLCSARSCRSPCSPRPAELHSSSEAPTGSRLLVL